MKPIRMEVLSGCCISLLAFQILRHLQGWVVCSAYFLFLALEDNSCLSFLKFNLSRGLRLLSKQSK